MHAGTRRLPRLACALAQRRRYLTVVLDGGDRKPMALKLCPPCGKTALAKAFEKVASPRVLTSPPSINNFRVTLADAVGASVELVPKETVTPKAMEVEYDSGEEEQSDEDEWDEFYPMEETSGDGVMDLFYHGGETEEEDGIEEVVEDDAFDKADEAVDKGDEVLPKCLLIDLCIRPHQLFATATISEQGNHKWRSSWSFSLDTHSEETCYSLHDQPLEYTGIISGSILDKFNVSLDHYGLKEILGCGGEGQVYKCEALTNPHNTYAIKWSAYDKLITEEPREALIMKNLCHPNVKRLFCAWKERREGFPSNSFFLVQELCKSTLEDLLNESIVTSISDRVKIFAEVVSGVKYLHAQGIVHRDIKSCNIFLDDHGSAKIGDFGQSGLISSRSCSYGGKLYGTLLYCAPELVRRERHGIKSDIFSLGMVYAELFGPTNVAAKRHEWLQKLSKLTKSRKWKSNPLSTWKKSELSINWSGDAYLMIKMLESSPEERPSCGDILDVLAAGAPTQ